MTNRPPDIEAVEIASMRLPGQDCSVGSPSAVLQTLLSPLQVGPHRLGRRSADSREQPGGAAVWQQRRRHRNRELEVGPEQEN